jgi:hypothetical protein
MAVAGALAAGPPAPLARQRLTDSGHRVVYRTEGEGEMEEHHHHHTPLALRRSHQAVLAPWH